METTSQVCHRCGVLYEDWDRHYIEYHADQALPKKVAESLREHEQMPPARRRSEKS